MDENKLDWQTGIPSVEGLYAVVEHVKHGNIILRNTGVAIYSHVGKKPPFFWRKNYKTHKRMDLTDRVVCWIHLPQAPAAKE